MRIGKIGQLGFLVLLVLMGFFFYSDHVRTNDLSAEIINKNGYHYLIYGSQVLGGIEQYDLKNDRRIAIIAPEKNNTRYIKPFMEDERKGVCVRESDIFSNKKKFELVEFDLQEKKIISVIKSFNGRFANVAISRDRQRLALIYKNGKRNAVLGIYDFQIQRIIKEISVSEDYCDNPSTMVWKSRNEVVLWNRLTSDPAKLYEVNSGESETMEYFPLAYTEKYVLYIEASTSRVCLLDKKSGIQTKLDVPNISHTFYLTNDSKYLVCGWLRGKGFETLAIMDVGSGKKYIHKMDDHSGTVLGLELL